MTENTIVRTVKTVYMNNAIPSVLCDFGMVGLNPLETNMRKIWKQKIDGLQKVIEGVDSGKDGRLKQLYRKKELLQMAFHSV